MARSRAFSNQEEMKTPRHAAGPVRGRGSDAVATSKQQAANRKARLHGWRSRGKAAELHTIGGVVERMERDSTSIVWRGEHSYMYVHTQPAASAASPAAPASYSSSSSGAAVGVKLHRKVGSSLR